MNLDRKFPLYTRLDRDNNNLIRKICAKDVTKADVINYGLHSLSQLDISEIRERAKETRNRLQGKNTA